MTNVLKANDRRMTEIELKLQLDPSATSAVTRWVRARGGRGERLRARYFDTADRQLAQAGLALRLRYERGRWVQTLKAALPGPVARFEHEVVVQRGKADLPPAVNPALHQATDAAPLLAKAIARGQPYGLHAHFETDIRRVSAHFRSRRGEVEISVDTGVITAPGKAGLRVCEVEVELLKGSPLAVTDVARQVVRGYPCWVDPASKAERGHRLAAALDPNKASRAGTVQLDPRSTIRTSLGMVAHECRRHLLTNLARIASDQGHDAEHVHQARVALRRLRTAIRLFEYEPLQRLDGHARALAHALGVTRERDVLLESVVPELNSAGAPPITLAAPPGGADASGIVRERGHQRFLLDLIAAELALARSSDTDTDPIGTQLIGRLVDWHRKVRRDARRFATLDDDHRHRLRRRMKRLRYGLEFCKTLCSDKRYRQFLGAMSYAQESLGRYNDLVEALASYRAQIDSDPRAWFAVGWLTGEIKSQALHCTTALATLRECKGPWKRRHLPRPPTAPPASITPDPLPVFAPPPTESSQRALEQSPPSDTLPHSE